MRLGEECALARVPFYAPRQRNEALSNRSSGDSCVMAILYPQHASRLYKRNVRATLVTYQFQVKLH